MFKYIVSILLMMHQATGVVAYGSYEQVLDTTLKPVQVEIIDADTKKPVVSHITYEKMPFGSKIGVVKNSAFTFTLAPGESYQIHVKAAKYITTNLEVKYEDVIGSQEPLVIELLPKAENKIIRLEHLFFRQGKYTIDKESYGELDGLATMLKSNPKMVIQLEGHTDFRGNARQNLKLSQQRVDAVKKYLKKRGVEQRRIKTKAFGGTQPLARGNDPTTKRKNRRVEVRIISQ